MLKSIVVQNQVVVFDLKREQEQIRFALAKDWGPAPQNMETRHWLLEEEWKHSLPDGSHDFVRNEELEKLLVL